jgi:hypothetical protein
MALRWECIAKLLFPNLEYKLTISSCDIFGDFTQMGGRSMSAGPGSSE